MIFYVDKLFLINFIMSYLILVITAEILQIKYKKIRLISGSVIATLITIISIIYDIKNSVLIRMIIISFMALISFKYKNIKIFLVQLVTILTITFLIGGIMNASINNSLEIILWGIICIIALKEYSSYYKNKKWKVRNEYRLKFEIEDKKIEVNAFLDTGNFLTSNMKEESVIVISKEFLKDKVSTNILNLFLKGEIGDLNFKILKNIRPINYFVLNEEMKMTYGLKVKNIQIEYEDRIIIKDAIIVVSENKIKESDAIIGLSLLEGGMESGNTINVKTKSKEIVC